MAITSVDSFIRIFKFYQANPLVRKERDSVTGKIKSITLKDIFKNNSLIYQDTVDVYLHSLTLDKLTQLSYDDDGNTIQHAINAREKLSKYFTKVLYPGSYAYSTLDNAAVRKMMLDWSSAIKTIQDANRKVTNAYSLNSNDLDKAIRGFGIDFINSNTLKSTERRKNFLLKICDLYSIKGSPDSIIQALNTIGLEDIFIREAWICKQDEKYNGDYNLKLCWKAQKLQQEFDSIQNQYQELNTHDDIYTTWEWFKDKIQNNASTFDPHWFYDDNQIKSINNDPNTFIKLPSITPYFGIEFTSDLDRNIDSLDTLFNELTYQYQSFFNSDQNKGKTIWVDNYSNRLNILECYTGLIYTLIKVDEHIQYQNFKSYLELNKFDTPDFKHPYEYFKLIYWMYQHRKDTFEISYNKLLRDYIPIKSNTYTSYENVLKWWLESEVTDYERKGVYNDVTEKWDRSNVISDPYYIIPRKVESDTTYENFIQLEWDAPYATGRYCIECYNEEDGWVEIVTNGYIYESTMTCCISSDYAEHGSSDVTDFRIVMYHHPSNIPEIFFNQPFNFNAKPTNTLLDRVLRYNGPITSLSFYDNDDPVKGSFINQEIAENTTTYDTISGYHEEYSSGNIRTTQIHTDLKSYYCGMYNYPSKTKLLEDKWMNINSLFYNYVDWSCVDYYDTITHNGLLESNIVSGRKWPINKKWNWAIDSKYYYVCYESNKWMRYPISGFIDDNSIQTSDSSYGSRLIIDNKLLVSVGSCKWAVIEGIVFDWDNKTTDLLNNGKIKPGSELSRTLAVGQIKNDEIINLLYETSQDKSGSTYKEALKQLNQSTIEVYTDPFGNNLVTTNCYTYNTFLTYLYTHRLTIDFSNGYIYPVIEGYVDDHCWVYLKCKTVNGYTKWVRFENNRNNIEWSNCEGCESIYNDEVDCGLMLPPYTLPNRYDSMRILDGRMYNYRKELIEAFEAGQIPDYINLVVVRAYNASKAGKYAETQSKYMINHPVVYKKQQVITESGSLKIAYEWVPVEDNRLSDCYIGLNPDLMDWIDEILESDDQYYVDLPAAFAEAVNNYLINTLGISGSVLDLIIASWSNSSIVKKIVNYYKPKRARLLFISDALDSDYALSNGLDSLGLTDNDYNYYDLVTYRWGNPNFDTRNLSKMNRQRIRQVIGDYLSIEDSIYKDGDESNKIFNYRELYSPDSKIPEIEVYDDLIDITRQTVETRNGNSFAVFYVQGLSFDDTMTGFYYQINLDDGKKIYSNNSWYFEKCEFTTKTASGRIKITERWAIFKGDNNDATKDNAYYVADRESERPWISDDNSEIYYGNCQEHKRFIDDYDFSEGTFITDRYVKVGKRNISPVLYFRCFDNESCNGFYYYDSNIHPDRNSYPVYYNLRGKMITLVDTESYYSRIDPETGNTITKFWCIMDYKQIADFSGSDYFAFSTIGDASIFDSRNNDFTKQFYKLSRNDNEENDHSSALVGCSMGFVTSNPDVIRSNERRYSAVYDKYERFKRNHVNRIELDKKPISCLVSDGVTVINYFNHNDDNKKIFVGDEVNDVSNAKIKLTLDDIGNEKGAFEIRDTVVFSCNLNNSEDWTISIRMKFIDTDSISKLFDNADDLVSDRWYMITINSKNECFINGIKRDDIIQKFIKFVVESEDISDDYESATDVFIAIITDKDDVQENYLGMAKITFKDVNCDIAELGIWDEVLDTWYIKSISNFRILRSRPETSRSKINKSASNFRPLFAQEQPRIVFNRWSTGLPENIIGGRFDRYVADKLGSNKEENPLWVNRLDHNLDKNLIIKGASHNYPPRDSINIGRELESSSDYIPNDTIQWWWMRYNSDFKTGPIHHRPVYISVQQKLNDPYPVVKYGKDKTGNYFDSGLLFDGYKNSDNAESYKDETYDENTGFGINETESIVKLDNIGDTFKKIDFNDSIYILDLDQMKLDRESIRNFIFHETIYLYNIDAIYSEFIGEWKHSKEVKSWRDGDFKECYTRNNKFEAVFTYNKETGYFWWEIRKLNESGVWETYFRTYVNAKHNQSRLMYVYDFINNHQIDICNQQLCKFKENEFTGKCWGEVNQEFLNTSFGCNKWIRFICKKSSELTHIGTGNYFDGKQYHVVIDNKWYLVSAEKNFVDGFKYLPDTKTPSGYLYADNYLYIWIDNPNVNIKLTYTDDGKSIAHKTQIESHGYWIRIFVNNVTNLVQRIPYELWKFRKTSSDTIIVNVIDSSNTDHQDNSYITCDAIDIQETYWKLIKFNGINDWKWWNHMNEEFPYLKSVNNDITCTIASVEDSLSYQTFEVNGVGDYIKVKYPNGVIDFVTKLPKDAIRIGELQYAKINDSSNV